ncbi:MAG TPA: hypothetical protein VG144_05010 [Gaiellaceae bacterium]|nr:hypothetical protein [Gaiellaceae bacterium]
MRRALLLLALTATVGCSLGDGGASIERSELQRLVLQPDDVPRIFVLFDEGRQARADQPPGPRADPERFGRTEGWKARYRRPGSGRTSGPLVIESRVDVFASVSGAEDDFVAAREELRGDGLGWHPIDEPGLGDESFAATFVQRRVRYYQVFWREDNATAALHVNGFEGKLPLSDALRLARKQQERLERAAES